MTVLRTYLCNEKFLAIAFEKPNLNAIQAYDNYVEAKMVSVGCNPERHVIHANMISDARMESMLLFFQELERCIGKGYLKWVRKANYNNHGDFYGLDTSITVEFLQPNSPCHWAYTHIYSLRKDMIPEQNLLISTPSREGGETPESKGDFSAIGGHRDINNTQTLFVPGALLQLKWALRAGGKVFSSVVAGKYFATPAITGGEILYTGGEGESSYFAVDVQGETFECAPTDFANYQTGDWVFVLKQDDGHAGKADRNSAYSDRSASLDDSTFSKKDFSDIARDLMILINEERSKQGLDNCTVASSLTSSAERHVEDMASGEFLSHIGSDSSNSRQRILEAGFVEDQEDIEYSTGENIARSQLTAKSVLRSWMMSSEYGDNILNPDFTEIGVAVNQYSDDDVYYCATFGKRSEISVVDLDTSSSVAKRVIPLTVNDVGNENRAYESLDYNMLSAIAFKRFFEMSVHEGVIKALWPSNVTPLRDAARVEITKLGEDRNETKEIEWIDIFYHCQGSDTVSGGMAAFAVDDEVIVLNESGSKYPNADNLKVIGHKTGKKYCSVAFLLLVSSQNGEEACVWDMWNNEIFIEKSSMAGIISQLQDLEYYNRTNLSVTGIEQDLWESFQIEHDCVLNLPDATNPEIAAEVAFYPYKPRLRETDIPGYDREADIEYIENPTISYERVASCIWIYEAHFYHSEYKTEFETLTGVSWPEDADGYPDDFVIRFFMFFVDPFAYDMDGVHGGLHNCQEVYDQLLDSWADLDWWYEGSELKRDYAAFWRNYGIATNAAGSVVYSMWTMCRDATAVYDDSEGYEKFDHFESKCNDYLKFSTDTYLYFKDVRLLTEDSLEKDVLTELNQIRVENTLEEFTPSPNLQQAAERHAADMASGDFLSHTGSDGTTSYDRVVDEGYMLWTKPAYQRYIVSENVARADMSIYSLDVIIDAWMDSDAHRRNILHPEMNEIGISTAVSAGGDTYYCVVFGHMPYRWVGFGAMDTTGLKTYIASNFKFEPTESENEPVDEHDEDYIVNRRLLDMYLI